MPVMTGIPSSHLHRLIIPDDVLIQFDLLMMSAVTLENMERHEINKYVKKCVKLVNTKNRRSVHLDMLYLALQQECTYLIV